MPKAPSPTQTNTIQPAGIGHVVPAAALALVAAINSHGGEPINNALRSGFHIG